MVRHPLQPFDAAQLRARRAGARDASGASTTSRCAARRRWPPSAARAAPLPARPAAAARGAGRRARRARAFVRHPVRAFLRSASGISVADYTDDVQDALPVALDGLERVGRRPAAAGRAAGRRRAAATRSSPRSRAARSRPASSASRSSSGSSRSSTGSSPRRRGASRGSIDVAVELPGGRTAQRDGGRRRRRRAAHRHLLAASARATGSPPGCGCSRSAPRTRTAPSRRSRVGKRPRGRRRRRARSRRSTRRSRASYLAELARPLRARHARARAAVLPDVRGLRGGGRRPHHAWESGPLRRPRTRSAEHELVLGGRVPFERC